VSDAGGFTGADLDRLMSETRRALAAAASSSPPATDTEGVGVAADDQVRAVVRLPGQLTELHVDPRLMRLPSEELTEQVITAVNAALEDLRRKSVAAAMPADLNRLGSDLAALQTDSIRQMQRFTSAMTDAISRTRPGNA
jgi:hypothetical protein